MGIQPSDCRAGAPGVEDLTGTTVTIICVDWNCTSKLAGDRTCMSQWKSCAKTWHIACRQLELPAPNYRRCCNWPALALGKCQPAREFRHSAWFGALLCWFLVPWFVAAGRTCCNHHTVSVHLGIHFKTFKFDVPFPKNLRIQFCIYLSTYTASNNQTWQWTIFHPLASPLTPPPSVLRCIDRLHRPYQQSRHGGPWWQ